MKLRYTLPALADLNSVLDYIAAHSPQGARRVHARIQAIIDLLLLSPGIGTRTDAPTTRRMTALPYPYLIFSEATETEIIIHAVRHAARARVGRMLLALAFVTRRKAGFSTATLNTEPNTRAERFYRPNTWTETARSPKGEIVFQRQLSIDLSLETER